VDYGPTSHEVSDDNFGSKHQRNLEQATRRALRGLEKRGLVRLDRYPFTPDTEDPTIHWRRVKHHLPGQSRYMIGATLTDPGRVEAGAERLAASAEAEAELNSLDS
jgi:hypothetical protein